MNSDNMKAMQQIYESEMLGVPASLITSVKYDENDNRDREPRFERAVKSRLR